MVHLITAGNMPKYKQPSIAYGDDTRTPRSEYAFVFSSNIRDWIHSKTKQSNDANHIKRKYTRKITNAEKNADKQPNNITTN